MQQKQHIVILTFPAYGHVTPMLSLAKLLVPHGFTFTIAVAENLAQKFQPEFQPEVSCAPSPVAPPIRVAPLAFTKKPPTPGTGFSMGALFEFLNSTQTSFETLLGDLVNSGGNPHVNGHGAVAAPVSCIIADSFNTWSREVASRFRIPMFGFFVSSAHVFSALLHSKAIGDRLASVPDLDQIIDFIPGVQPLPAKDLPQSILEALPFAMSVVKDVDLDLGFILNTVHETESKSVEAIKTKVPVYSFGPFSLMENSIATTGNKDGATGIEKQNCVVVYPSSEDECIKWLDSKPDSSVIFVSFGSLVKLSYDALRELAIGLENSNQAFVWVIRADVATAESGLTEILPKGFIDRTKERGLIIQWAPQLEVLAHQAIGGFMTQCGWNSIMENLSLGAVPMICWPQMAEQKMNARILVDEWKVALDLKEDDGIVKAETIQKGVNDILVGSVGNKLKARALEIKGIIHSAVKKGGSSYNDLEGLVQQFKKLSTTINEVSTSWKITEKPEKQLGISLYKQG